MPLQALPACLRTRDNRCFPSISLLFGCQCCAQNMPVALSSNFLCRAKTPNITKKRQARQSMRPKVEPQAKRLRSSTTVSVASPDLNFSTEDCEGILDMNKQAAMEAVSEEEDERIMDLEAEIEELREQVHMSSQLDCVAEYNPHTCQTWAEE